ncbi:alpha/beta fold hydrolase [Thiocapsa imhoffii]|uniref:alpha/beta fold hydrolase n=1 Tax=Thiocapsa imhoffii TaxID=382777 RepID=UPI0023EE29EB|nr:alpha/beta fold hydrolase [Thiocapsa imhoffii]
MLHGFTGRASDWWMACPQLRDDPRAWAIDLPGHGPTDQAVKGFEETIQGLLAALPAEVDALAGYSLGGRLALGLLTAAPLRFRRALIISAHPGLRSMPERDARNAHDAQWLYRLRVEGLASFVASWETQPLFATQARLDPERLRWQRQHRLSHRPEALASSLERLGLGRMPSLWDGVRDFPGQLTWVVGGSDTKFLAIARAVRQLRPTTHLHVLPKIGHNPLLECPGRLEPLIHHTLGQAHP